MNRFNFRLHHFSMRFGVSKLIPKKQRPFVIHPICMYNTGANFDSAFSCHPQRLDGVYCTYITMCTVLSRVTDGTTNLRVHT